MRAGATQSSPTAHPDIRITIGGDTYTSQDDGRLTRAYLDEQVWGGQYVFEIDNSDESLNSKDYKGSGATIYLGFIGGSGSNMSPVWIHNQQLISKEGKLLLQLNCIDAWGLLSQVNADLAMAAYNQYWQQSSELDERKLPSGEDIPAALKTAIAANYGKTIFAILEDLVGTIGVTVTKDDDDGIVDTREPPLRVSNPVSGIRQALDMTKCYLKWKTGGTFGTYRPGAHATVYSFNAANLIFNNLEDVAVVIPNRVTFYALNAAGTDWINGTSAVDSDSYSKLGVYVDRHYLLANFDMDGRSSTAELTALAEGALDKIQGERSQGVMVAPMHCALELFDKIEIQDGMYDPARTTTGYIHRIIREYNRGIYRITLQLGGVTGGYTPPGGNDAAPLVDAGDQPSIPQYPTDVDWKPAYLPAVIDINFTAVDDDDITWTSGTIKTADGSVFNISSGSKNLANANVYYAYYDVEADTGVIEWTQTFGDTVSHERILIGFFKKGVDGEPALIVIGTKGPDLFVDVLSAITANLGLINAGEIRLGTGTLGVDFTGWRLWVESGIGWMAGYQNDVYQYYTGSDGRLYAGAGAIYLDSEGINIKGEHLLFKDANGNNIATIQGYTGKILYLWLGDYETSTVDGTLHINCKDIVCELYVGQSIRPFTDGVGTLGTIAKQWKGAYCKDRLKIPVGVDMYD